MKRLIAQFLGLERRTGRGRDTVNHGPHGHDDLANAVAGAVVAVASVPHHDRPTLRWAVEATCEAPATGVASERAFYGVVGGMSVEEQAYGSAAPGGAFSLSRRAFGSD